MNSFSFHATLFILRLMLYVDYCIIGISKLKILKLHYTNITLILIFNITRDVLLDSTIFKRNWFVYSCSFKANIYRIIFLLEKNKI